MPILPMGITGCGMRDAGCGMRDTGCGKGITGLKGNLGGNDGIEELEGEPSYEV